MATIAFFIWTFCSIFLTFNVFSPLVKRSNSSFRLILFSYFLGLVVGDLFPQWILLNLGILLIFTNYDILLSPIGLAGTICHIVCWIILSIRLWIIIDLPGRMHLKMLENFGTKWYKVSKGNLYPRNFLDIDWYSWLNPIHSIKDPRIEIIRNQVYHNENGLELKLDIYRPKNIKKKRPGILQIHGGAWITGSKRQSSFFLLNMALKGWVCFSVTHRFSPKNVFPEHLIDIKRALKWIRENADLHGLDKNFIISKGSSSGGHLASLMALTQNISEFQPGFNQTDTSIQGCVTMYGVYNFLDSFDKITSYPAKSKILEKVCGGTPKTKPSCYKKITPKNWISKEAPPFLVLHAETDALISIEESKKFWNDLQSRNVYSSVFLSIPLAEHGFDVFPTLTAQCIVPIIEQFLIMIHGNYLCKKEKNET